MAYDFDHDELHDEAEVGLVASFLQALQDYGEAGEDLESGDRVRVKFELTKEIRSLEEAGFWVYGAQIRRVLEANGNQLDWPVATVRVKRLGDLILKFAKEAEADQTAADPQASSSQAAV
jgi:hypothetical protein